MTRRLLAALLLAAPAAWGAPPSRFAIIFNEGYAGDHLPKDPAAYEQLAAAVTSAHFNVILGTYTDQRAEICRRHGLQLFVDLLAPEHDVRRNAEACRALCERLRGDPVIYGYHLWSDNLAGAAPDERTRQVRTVQAWDPTHPCYVGSYRLGGLARVQGEDLFGYYDFHWKRGGHWAHLASALGRVRARGIGFLRYDDAQPGLVGKGNPQRVGYTVATSVPFGLRGYLFHYTGGIVDAQGQLDALGRDLQKVNATFAAVGAELMKLELPTAVYSTPITADARDDVLAAPALPEGLAPVPAGAGFSVVAGEVLIGRARDAALRDVFLLAAHNPYRVQDVMLHVGAVRAAAQYDRAGRAWRPLAVAAGQVHVRVEAYAVELVRIERD